MMGRKCVPEKIFFFEGLKALLGQVGSVLQIKVNEIWANNVENGEYKGRVQ